MMDIECHDGEARGKGDQGNGHAVVEPCIIAEKNLYFRYASCVRSGVYCGSHNSGEVSFVEIMLGCVSSDEV